LFAQVPSERKRGTVVALGANWKDDIMKKYLFVAAAVSVLAMPAMADEVGVRAGPVGAFSESLRQEAVALGVRVTVIEPGAVATELPGHNRPEVREQIAKVFQDVAPLTAEDIADAVLYAIAQPANVSVNELLIRPSGQAR
jgi:NADP-dependent 3-hydroxy acid dehydrogenase YdfG